jgi:phage shock protein C
MNDRKLYRDDRNATIGGVCKGLADYFDIDVTIIRALFLLALVLKGGGVLIYIVLMVVMPKRPYFMGTPGVDYTMPPQGQPADPFIYQPAPRRKSNFSLVAGLVLIFLGGILLLDEYDVIPDWDFEHLWPVPLVAIGLVLVFSANKNKPTDPQPPIE